MSATLKKLEEIQKKRAELQREEAALKTLFMQEFVEIVSTLDPLKVDLDVLIGSIAITIDQAKHDNPALKTDAQVKLWKDRGAIELSRFRREKKRLEASRSEATKGKVQPQTNHDADSQIKEDKV